MGQDTNLEDLGPQLPRNEEPALSGIVGNAIQDRVCRLRPRGKQAGEVQPCVDDATARVDNRNPIGQPDIRKQLSGNDLELVQVFDGTATVPDLDAALLGKRV